MLILRILSRLPLPVLYIFSDFLAFMAGRVFKYRREVVWNNLKNSFPEKSETEIKKIIRGFYTNLADIIVETLKGISIPKDQLKKRVIFNNMEIMDEYYKKGDSVLVLTIHQCNWEWFLMAGCMHMKLPIDAVYLPLNNKKMDKLMTETRSRFGSKPIPVGSALREIIKTSETQKIVAMVADQAPMRDFKKYWTTFLNQETAFLMGPLHLPKFTKYPVVFMGMKRVKRGYYEVDIHKLAEPPYEKDSTEAIDNFVTKSEELIRENPADWLWTHKRWKYQRSLYD